MSLDCTDIIVSALLNKRSKDAKENALKIVKNFLALLRPPIRQALFRKFLYRENTIDEKQQEEVELLIQKFIDLDGDSIIRIIDEEGDRQARTREPRTRQANDSYEFVSDTARVYASAKAKIDAGLNTILRANMSGDVDKHMRKFLFSFRKSPKKSSRKYKKKSKRRSRNSKRRSR
jgi:hypothetical protein